MEIATRPGPERLARSLVRKGISPEVAELFARVPRERFVPRDLLGYAYEDRPLPIGRGQTISQPYIVGLMIQSLELTGRERVLEIGTGSGYQTALLSLRAAAVFSIERLEELLAGARSRLDAVGAKNVKLRCGDGTLGWPEEAPFDGIIVSAAAPSMPETLVGQLKSGGRMVVPVGGDASQELLRVLRLEKGVVIEKLTECSFVKLVGEEGYSNGAAS